MDKIRQIEDYVRSTMIGAVAHDFKHVDRVRQWALLIAEEEGFEDLEIVEVAALLHDIGSASVDEKRERDKHGQVGAEIAAKFLKENYNLTQEQIEQITSAIRHHCSPPSLVADLLRTIGEKGRLLAIIRDADTMDAIGAVGLMRAFTSKAAKLEYDPENFKGDTWGLSGREFDEKFAQGLGIGGTIIDQINFQISYYDNLNTKAAKRMAKPLIDYMKEYIVQLEHEINNR
ncbi:MAG: HD domain-containing protein [Dehalococcoidales bacterium]|nr:MAG: HD domain-containing protein [Dehalococcoidales bacterium]